MQHVCMKLFQLMNIYSALWILMAWCVSTRASVVTVLSMHRCIISCLWVNRFNTKYQTVQVRHGDSILSSGPMLYWDKGCIEIDLKKHFKHTLFWWNNPENQANTIVTDGLAPCTSMESHHVKLDYLIIWQMIQQWRLKKDQNIRWKHIPDLWPSKVSSRLPSVSILENMHSETALYIPLPVGSLLSIPLQAYFNDKCTIQFLLSCNSTHKQF